MSFFILFDQFLTLYSFLGAATKEWKESIGGPESELHAESFQKKKSITKSNIVEAHQTLILLVQPSAAI